MELTGLSALISGASQGLGYEVAKQFLQAGANIVICSRNETQINDARDQLLKDFPAAKIIAQQTDVADVKQVYALIDTAIKELGKLDVLVANAGIYGTKGPIDEVDWQEWSDAIDINLKGTVLQCRAVLPHFKQQKSGKIIILSGGGATKPMPNLSAYATSKAGVVRFAETLAEEVKSFNIDVNTVAPGALNTRLLDEILAAGPDKIGKEFYEQSLKQKDKGGTPLDVGASLCVFLASSLSNGISGRLLSAVWDPWNKLPEYLSELLNSDIYTLRRIVPKDRGQVWDEMS